MQKIKHFLKEGITNERINNILVVFIVILAGLGSFELGRLSMTDVHPNAQILNYESSLNAANSHVDESIAPVDNKAATTVTTKSNAEVQAAQIKTSKTYFASKRGKKYYTSSCSGGQTIKMENRVYFSSSSEAEKAGYTLSSTCN